jgi:hypothetical protein
LGRLFFLIVISETFERISIKFGIPNRIYKISEEFIQFLFCVDQLKLSLYMKLKFLINMCLIRIYKFRLKFVEEKFLTLSNMAGLSVVRLVRKTNAKAKNVFGNMRHCIRARHF